MITLQIKTAGLIRKEMESIPEKYQKPFNSMHEGLGVLREEYLELEQEIFFGEKNVKLEAELKYDGDDKEKLDAYVQHLWKENVRKEAVQVAAMACRIIQELTD